MDSTKVTSTARRCVLIARGHTDGDHSMKVQIDALTEYAREDSMTVVDNIYITKWSARNREMRDAIDMLVARKTKYDDFDVVVATEANRFSRDFRSAMTAIQTLVEAGIGVITLD